MAKNKNSAWKRINEMTDSALAYTVNQYQNDLKEYGGTTEKWQFYKMMCKECARRFINNILYDR